jgi:hypothetical protein
MGRGGGMTRPGKPPIGGRAPIGAGLAASDESGALSFAGAAGSGWAAVADGTSAGACVLKAAAGTSAIAACGAGSGEAALLAGWRRAVTGLAGGSAMSVAGCFFAEAVFEGTFLRNSCSAARA